MNLNENNRLRGAMEAMTSKCFHLDESLRNENKENFKQLTY